MAGRAWPVSLRYGRVRRGLVGFGRRGMDWSGWARPVKVCFVLVRQAGHGQLRSGEVGFGRQVWVRCGWFGLGVACFWYGKAGR
jgi:hypothetical protein